MRISSLTESNLPAIHETFLGAFADYPLPMRQTVEELRALLVLRGAVYERSFGAFVEGRMVGVWMTAVGHLDGAPTAYTVFTGVVPDHRGRGLGQDLFRAVAAALRDDGVTRVVHEVLIQNDRATRAYRKMGFLIRRDLVCMKVPIEAAITTGGPHDGQVAVHPVAELDPSVVSACRDWEPTWPCSDQTIARAAVSVSLEARIAGEVVGYAVVLPAGAGGLVDVPQLAVLKPYRRRRVATALLHAIVSVLPAGVTLRVLNIDASATGDLDFWRSIGAEEFARQHDMEWSEAG